MNIAFDIGTARSGVLAFGDGVEDLVNALPLNVGRFLPSPPKTIQANSEASILTQCFGSEVRFGLFASEMFLLEQFPNTVGISLNPSHDDPNGWPVLPGTSSDSYKFIPKSVAELTSAAIKSEKNRLNRFIDLILCSYFKINPTNKLLGRPTGFLSHIKNMHEFHEATACLYGYAVLKNGLQLFDKNIDIISNVGDCLGGRGTKMVIDLGGGFLDVSVIDLERQKIVVQDSFALGFGYLLSRMGQSNEYVRFIGKIKLEESLGGATHGYFKMISQIVGELAEAILTKISPQGKDRDSEQDDNYLQIYLSGKSWEHLTNGTIPSLDNLEQLPFQIKTEIQESHPGIIDRIGIDIINYDTKLTTTVGLMTLFRIPSDNLNTLRPEMVFYVDETSHRLCLTPDQGRAIKKSVNELKLGSVPYSIFDSKGGSPAPREARDIVRSAFEKKFPMRS